MAKMILMIILSTTSLLGGVYWAYIYVTKEGKEKRDGIRKYELLDRGIQIICLHVTLVVYLINIIMFGDLRFIK